jgi:transposase
MALEINNNEPPDWFKKTYSEQLQLPNNNFIKENINIHFGKKIHNDKYNEHYKFLNFNDTFSFQNYDNEHKIEKSEILKLKNKQLISAKTESSKKSIETKFDRKIKNKDKITVCHKFRIYPDKEQKKIINLWLSESLEIYNVCIEIFNADNEYFSKGFMSAKIEIFDFMDKKFKCPYDSRTHVISKFCDNIKSCFTNLKNGNIKTFEFKKKISYQNVYVPKTSITENSVFPSYLNNIKGINKYFTENNIDINDIGDSFLQFDRVSKKYYLIIPYYRSKVGVKNKKKVIALDPGEKIPFSYFSQEGFGHLGKDIRKRILNEQKNIKKLQSILSKGLNKDGKKINNKDTIRKKIQHHFNKIKNLVKELHNKVALYLVKNYDIILIPEFSTKNMISNNDKFKFIINNNPNTNIDKDELKKFMENNDIKNINIFLNLLSKEKIEENKNNINEIYKNVAKIKKEFKNKEISKITREFIEIVEKHKEDEIKYKKENIENEKKLKQMEKLILENQSREEKATKLKNTLEKNKNKNKDNDKDKKEKYKNENLKKILIKLKEKFGNDIMKIYRKKVTRKSRLNKRVKFVLQMLSHYSFRQHLKNKCIEYGCHMEIVTEEFTSKTCTKCGKIGNNFNNRTKKCSDCNYTINRDIGGARNILIKNLDLVLKNKVK